MPTPEIRAKIRPDDREFGPVIIHKNQPRIQDRRSGSTFVTRRDLRNTIIGIAAAYLILSIGQYWTAAKIQNNAREDLVENAVRVCERGIPVRVQTNTSSNSLKVVALGTGQFLRAVAPTLQTPELESKAKVLAGSLDVLAAAQRTVPVGNCNLLRDQLLK